jgi:hypothetical protein
MEKEYKGGKVIASGGFGCIFDPALKCTSPETEYKNIKNRITKLMTIKHATEEYKKIQQFYNILKVIPNYENYFLVNGFTLCKPDKLTKHDLTNYKKKCKALTKKNITVKNINNSLDLVLALNMPNAGINVEDFVDMYFTNNNNNNNNNNIIKLNNSLIDLLVNGILQMNKLNVFHCDIKDSNVLVHLDNNESNMKMKTRLIDWGISFSHNNFTGIPKNLYRRPFQYNVPFSSVLFNKEFTKYYNEFLTIHPNPDYYLLREFVINYIFVWNHIRGSGHLSAINDIIKKFFINDLVAIPKEKVKNHVVEYDFTYYYIIEYITKILHHYTKDGKCDIMAYFNTVFLKNIDVWGFVTIYISMFEKLYKYKQVNEVNKYQQLFINKIKYIVVHFLYESPLEPIKTKELADELTKLNILLSKFEINEFSDKILYLQEFVKINKNNKSKNNKTKNNKTKNNKTNKNNVTKRLKTKYLHTETYRSKNKTPKIL